MNPLLAFFFNFIVDFEPPTLDTFTYFFRIWQKSISEISLKLKYIKKLRDSPAFKVDLGKNEVIFCPNQPYKLGNPATF